MWVSRALLSTLNRCEGRAELRSHGQISDRWTVHSENGLYIITEIESYALIPKMMILRKTRISLPKTRVLCEMSDTDLSGSLLFIFDVIMSPFKLHSTFRNPILSL